MVTIKDIACQLGISVSTVSKGLNGAADISRELRHTVINTAVETGYAVKRFRKNSSRKLCVFIEKTDYIPALESGCEVLLGFQQAAAFDDRTVYVIPYPIIHRISLSYDAYMLKHGFSGAFFVGSLPRDDWKKQLSSTVVPTVLLGNCSSASPCVSQISTDLFEAVDAGISHLLSLHHTRIAFLYDTGNPASAWFQRAFDTGARVHGFPCKSCLPASAKSLTQNAGIQTRRLLLEGTTAIMCDNDLLAHAVIKECAGLGLSVPQDVSIIGFGDFAAFPQASPPLTTIRQDWTALGKGGYYTLSALFQKISVGKTLLRAKLVLRGSTAPCKNNPFPLF